VGTCANSYDGVGTPLQCRPGDLEDVEASFVADPAPDAVGRLGHWVTVERQLESML
jgi:hypothetical protein